VSGQSPSQDYLAKAKSNVGAMENERQLRDIDYEIKNLEREVDGYQSAMDGQLVALQRKKSLAKNNLAGATWEQSISTEMQAISERYRTRIQITQDRIVSLHKQADDLSRKRQ